MSFTLRSYVEERVQAWQECGDCTGTGSDHSLFNEKMDPAIPVCTTCHGSGGRWYEALELLSSNPNAVAHLIGGNYTGDCWASKSSTLIRRWEVCEGEEDTPCMGDNCWICKGTRAEPDTAFPWEVE